MIGILIEASFVLAYHPEVSGQALSRITSPNSPISPNSVTKLPLYSAATNDLGRVALPF